MWHTIMLDQRLRGRRAVRRDPLPRRLPALSAGAPLRDALPDHAARPARPARPRCRCTAHFADQPLVSISDASASRCPTRNWLAHRAPRAAARPVPLPCRAAGLLRLRRPHLAGEARRPRDRDRDRLRHAAAHRRQGRPARPSVLRAATSGRCSTIRWSSSSARSATTQKNDFIGDARALLFPIDWPEPFGLVMIEALACGTPVIAYRCGSVPEVMEHGVTGFIVRNQERGDRRRARASTGIDRQRCRARFERRFTRRRWPALRGRLPALIDGAPSRRPATPLPLAPPRGRRDRVRRERAMSEKIRIGDQWYVAGHLRARRGEPAGAQERRDLRAVRPLRRHRSARARASRASTTRTRASCRTSSC